jgi:hypothetical protein
MTPVAADAAVIASDERAEPTPTPRHEQLFRDSGELDALAATAGEPTKIAPSPRKPGVYPILVVHELDAAPHAYILGCAQVTKAGAKLLGPAACAKVIGTPKVEIVGDDGTRAPAKLGKRGKGFPCPAEDEAIQPWVAVSGLPSEHERVFVLPAGVQLLDGIAEPATVEALRTKHSFADKRQQRPGSRSIPITGLVDLDGDGVLEVITSNLGSVRLFRADGELVGEVGCEFG